MAFAPTPSSTGAARYMNIPGQTLYSAHTISSAPQAMTGGPGGMGLPLNIVSLIIAQIDNLGDVSRLCRTSRLLYYMALPKLYENVTLRSYTEVRRVNGRVEGLGGGSPICTALGALATSQAASVVKHLLVQGSWKETDDYMLGRIPDATVLLSIAVRAAIDRMINMYSFSWTLDTKPLRSIYQGLTLRPSLTSFTLEFPSSRTPRPVLLVPPIPSLKSFTVRNLDPLCYNDDVSHLIYGSRNLVELTIHFSPRMRLEAECSASLSTYFGRCIQAGYKIPIQKIMMQNFYGPNRGQLYQAMMQETMVSSHFLDMFGGAHGPRTNVFIDETWRRIPPVLHFNWKIHRSNELAMQHTRILRGFHGLEELYLVSRSLQTIPSPPPAQIDSPTSPLNPLASTGSKTASPAPTHLSSSSSSAPSPSSAPAMDPSFLPGAEVDALGAEYLDAILSSHGTTLHTLLLFDKFGLDESQIADIATRAPLMRHLGVALEGKEGVFRKLIPSFPKLRTLRILENHLIRRLGVFEEENLAEVCKEFGRQIVRCGNEGLRWIGIGELVFKVGRREEFETAKGGRETRAVLERRTWGDVEGLGLWDMDKLEL
ncbi:hypothetical protein KVT40_000087 [Elsinoe batatas]|uniref:Uncharacterized protein n=1 Tax=Elsinoe batatas TaxID=2601811 RepID=A0A8K0PJX5_9PEZI|nr:hypothetical protein KVT40_000087 [Elsinoe batatas]